MEKSMNASRLLIVWLLLTMLLSACVQKSPLTNEPYPPPDIPSSHQMNVGQANTTDNSHTEQQFPDELDETTRAPGGFSVPMVTDSYEILTYTDAPNEKSFINIQYPHFFDKNLDDINAMVLEKVESFLEYPATAYPGFGLTIDYQASVTLQNSKIVSIIFWGESFVEKAAHSFDDIVCLNIDLQTMKEITLADLYKIDQNFKKIFFEKAFFPQNPVTSFDEDSFSEVLTYLGPTMQTIDPFDYMSCFFKPDGIVLSSTMAHATGCDHFEAQLSYEDIQQYYLPKQIYWQEDRFVPCT